MAKYCGNIGFCVLETTVPGVWEEKIVARKYYGDLNRNSRRLQGTDHLNDTVSISNEISIVADPYARENFHNIRYAEFMGIKWKVTSVDVQYPRLILALGEVFNGGDEN